MNRYRYRIVFNRALGVPQAVAETARARDARARPLSGHARVAGLTATLHPLAFAMALLLGHAPPASAQIVADPAAPGGQRPTVLQSANGVPLVNIQTPSAAGVSRNSYRQFDVDDRGAILNNARTAAPTQLGGAVAGNPWLAAGTARVILNEINASDPSRLHGYVEVAGDRAQLVIANPAGIHCDGCGFINASRTTLTTGRPLMQDGALRGYQVDGGAIRVEGRGMDGSAASYTELIARSLEINAAIWAQQLDITTGLNRIDDQQIVADATTRDDRPAFAVDVGALGGMYAGRILLVGTEHGVGVRNAGQIGAPAGELVVTADGSLINSGEIGAAVVRLALEEAIDNRGLIDGEQVRVDAATIDNTGRLFGDRLALQADLLLNHPHRDDEGNGDTSGAGFIAARERLDIGAAVLVNRDAALILSAGSSVNAFSIGGHLNADDHADGRALQIHNASATIESFGGLTIRSDLLHNSNEHFASELVQVGAPQALTYIQPKGDPNRYDIGMFRWEPWSRAGRYRWIDGPLTGETVRHWTQYHVTRTEYETVITDSAPALIRAGGMLQLHGGKLINDKSRITAGGNLLAELDALHNLDAIGERRIQESGTSQYTHSRWRGGFRRYHERRWDPILPYTPADIVTTFDLGIAVMEAGAGNDSTIGSEQLRELAIGSRLRSAPDAAPHRAAIRFRLAPGTLPAGLGLNLPPVLQLDASLREQQIQQRIARLTDPQRRGDGDSEVLYDAPADRHDLTITLSGELKNSGTIASRQSVAINATDLHNSGTIRGNRVELYAGNDLIQHGGAVDAGTALHLTAGRDLRISSTTQSDAKQAGASSFTRTSLDRTATLSVDGEAGQLRAYAGRDLRLDGAQLTNVTETGETVLAAARNLHLGTVQTATQENSIRDGRNYLTQGETREVGSRIDTSGAIALQSGSDIDARAAAIYSAAGEVSLQAGDDIRIDTGEASHNWAEGRSHRHRSMTGSTRNSSRSTLEEQTAIASTISGTRVRLDAGADIAIRGSQLISDEKTALIAGNDITVTAATETFSSSEFRETKRSGLYQSGDAAISVGRQQQSADARNDSQRAYAASVASLDGSVGISADNRYLQQGSHLLAPAGDITIDAAAVDIVEAREQGSSSETHRLRQSGATAALSAPAIDTLQTIRRTQRARQEIDDPRSRRLATATGAMAAGSAYSAIKADPSVAGGLNLSLTVGGRSSHSEQQSRHDSAAGSTIAAGGDVAIRAGGRDTESNLIVRGSRVDAGGDIQLDADGEIALLAAENRVETTRRSRDSGGGVGVAINIGSEGMAMGITANASHQRGSGEGSDLIRTETIVSAGNKLHLRSGRDTTLKGAVVSAHQMSADVGGDLTMESLQDTHTYHSDDRSTGGSVTFGAGFSGSLNIGSQQLDSDYASVVQQTALRAGDGGFRIEVAGHTSLTGALIASTAAAEAQNRNYLRTATLSATDLHNHAAANMQSSGFALSSDMFTQGKYGAAKGAIGFASGDVEEQTGSSGIARATISGADIVITDPDRQLTLTGTRADDTIAALHREPDTALTAAEQTNLDELRRTANAERVIREAFLGEALKRTDEAYRVSYLKKAELYAIPLDDDGNRVLDANGQPLLVKVSDAKKANLIRDKSGNVKLFTNGIFNELVSAANYAVQMSQPKGGETVYLAYFPQANSFLAELAVAGLQAFLEGGIADLTNTSEGLVELYRLYGNQGLDISGHSRGTMTVGNALRHLAKENSSTPLLTQTQIRYVGPADNAQQAANNLSLLSGGQQTSIALQNHADDFVGTLIGRNPATYDKRPDGSNRLLEWLKVFGDAPTVHSCYGTMAINPTECKENYGPPRTQSMQSDLTLRTER
jgi:filamentous hemagglutinin